MKAAVSLCVLVALTVANAVPHGYLPFNVGHIDQAVISEDVSKPVAYGYSIRTSSADALPISVSEDHVTGAFGYKIKAASPVVSEVVVSQEGSSTDAKKVGSGQFGYFYHTSAPVAFAGSPVYQHSIVPAPVAVEFKGSTGNTENVSGKSGDFSYSVHAETPVIAQAPLVATVPVSHEHSPIQSEGVSVSDKSVGSFAYSYQAEVPIAAALPVSHHAVVPSPIAVEYKDSAVKPEAVSGKSGGFAYSVHADAPVLTSVPVAYEQTVVKSDDFAVKAKPSGAFAYSYTAEAPIAAPVPVAHHAVVASPITVEYKDSAVKTEAVSGKSGGFAYSVHADAPVLTSVPVAYEQTVVKSDDFAVKAKPSGAFAYSYTAEAPIAAPVPVPHHAVVPSPIAVEYKDSAVKPEAVSGKSGGFAYSVHADAPVFTSVPVAYEQTVVKSDDFAVKAKPSGAFAYSYTAEAPIAAPIPVAHHAVVPSPIAVEYKDSAVKPEAVSGKSGGFAYSVHADAPVFTSVPVAYEQTVVKADDFAVKAKPSGAFAYSYTAEAPIAAPVPVPHHAVVASPIAVEYKDSAVKTEAVSGKSGGFAYSVHADAPVLTSVPVAYEQTVVKSDDFAVKAKPSGAFAYSYTAEAPIAAPVPVPHHAVVPSPIAVEYKDSAVKPEAVSGKSGGFAYSVHADAPVFISVPVAYEQTVVKSDDFAVKAKPSGAFAYSYTAEAPIAAPVPVAHHAVVPSPIAVEYKDSAVKPEAVSGKSGGFAYSVHADAPVLTSVPVAYEQTVVNSDDFAVKAKPSGAFAYSYTAEAPIAAPVPVPHHAVVASPIAVEYKDSAVKTEAVSGKSGGFAYSVHADAPVLTSVPVAYEQTVVKSDDFAVKAKPSGAFAYSYTAEAPIAAPVPVAHHAVVASPIAVEYKDSAVKTEAVSGQSGGFAYSVQDAAHGAYAAVAPVGVSYENSFLNYGDKFGIAGSKSSGSFGYSYHAEAPLAVVPVAEHQVISPAPISYAHNIDHDKVQGSDKSGAFSYSVHADAPLAYVPAAVTYNSIPTASAVSAKVDSSDSSYGYYVQSGAPVPELEKEDVMSTQEVTVKSHGYHPAFGVRTAPLNTVITGYQPAPVGYAAVVPIATIRADCD